MGPTWVLSASDGPHVGPLNLAIRGPSLVLSLSLYFQVHANKMILAMWSPVFAAMFKHDFKEKHAKSIELPGKKHEAVIQLMKVLHPPNEELCGGFCFITWGPFHCCR